MLAEDLYGGLAMLDKVIKSSKEPDDAKAKPAAEPQPEKLTEEQVKSLREHMAQARKLIARIDRQTRVPWQRWLIPFTV